MKFLESPEPIGDTNEHGLDEYSDSWLAAPAGLDHVDPLQHSPSPRLHPVETTRLASERLLPVTAAQLFPILTGFLVPDHDGLDSSIQKNRRSCSTIWQAVQEKKRFG